MMLMSKYFCNTQIGIISELLNSEFHLIVESIYCSNRHIHDELLRSLSTPHEIDVDDTRYCEVLFCLVEIFPKLINIDMIDLLRHSLPCFDDILKELKTSTDFDIQKAPSIVTQVYHQLNNTHDNNLNNVTNSVDKIGSDDDWIHQPFFQLCCKLSMWLTALNNSTFNSHLSLWRSMNMKKGIKGSLSSFMIGTLDSRIKAVSKILKRVDNQYKNYSVSIDVVKNEQYEVKNSQSTPNINDTNAKSSHKDVVTAGVISAKVKQRYRKIDGNSVAAATTKSFLDEQETKDTCHYGHTEKTSNTKASGIENLVCEIDAEKKKDIILTDASNFIYLSPDRGYVKNTITGSAKEKPRDQSILVSVKPGSCDLEMQTHNDCKYESPCYREKITDITTNKENDASLVCHFDSNVNGSQLHVKELNVMNDAQKSMTFGYSMQRFDIMDIDSVDGINVNVVPMSITQGDNPSKSITLSQSLNLNSYTPEKAHNNNEGCHTCILENELNYEYERNKLFDDRGIGADKMNTTQTNNYCAEYNACSDEELSPGLQSASNLQKTPLDTTSTSKTMVVSAAMANPGMAGTGNSWHMLPESPTLSNISFATGCKRALCGIVDGQVNSRPYNSATSATNHEHSNYNEEDDSSLGANQTSMNVKTDLGQNNHHRDSQSTGLKLLTSISPLTLPNEQMHLHARKFYHSDPLILGEEGDECTDIEKIASVNDNEIEMYGLNIQRKNDQLISSMSSIFSTDSNSSGTMHITPHDVTHQAYEVRKRPRDEPVFFDIEETY